MVKHVPQADEKSAKMGWFFDPVFIHNVQRVAADIENPSMEAIDSVLFALREMGFIKVAGTCEHGFTVDDCVAGLRERVKRLEDALRAIATYSAYDHPDQRDIKRRDDVLAEIQKCSACKHAKSVNWPPSGLCDNHYDEYHRTQRRVENMYEYKQSWEPIEIARRALEATCQK